MIVISEILANPAGVEREEEFVEVYNEGEEGVNLAGYIIKDLRGDEFRLSGFLGPGEYKAWFRPETGITLNNSNESVWLHQGEEVIDRVDYLQTESGKSLVKYREEYILAEPTPGEKNILPEMEEGVEPRMLVVPVGFKSVSFWMTMVVVSLAVAILATYLYSKLDEKDN